MQPPRQHASPSRQVHATIHRPPTPPQPMHPPIQRRVYPPAAVTVCSISQATGLREKPEDDSRLVLATMSGQAPSHSSCCASW